MKFLINRKIKDKEKFFNPKISDFAKDLNIPGIEKAQKRILQAIKNNELIIAYGDYDVDGICGAAVLYLGLTKMGAKVLPYIPHREKEGYGLSSAGLDFAKSSGAELIISCDTGIVAFEQAEYAKKLKIDLIITDHHQPQGTKRPDAYAIVHSLALCGTAVAWTLFQDENLLDLVALATVADMMPLMGANRALVKEGLKKLNLTQRVGLLALFNEAGIKLGEIGSYEIGHIIAPRLNAMGRLEHAMDSLRLLCT
ncbi:DHH family phosphoesterase, partial [Candidatus Daviesbacteria bacterium]|nr:DHH family phosphoesterase [Candidatus Daviesbacteria bacterium]